VFAAQPMELYFGRVVDHEACGLMWILVALVSVALAERMWPGQNAIGKRMQIGGTSHPPYTIIGVTGNVKGLFYGDDGLFKESVQRMLDHVPLGRPATVDEIAVAALFLADPENSYMTGHVLTVDGGMSL
jgi:NAD(P)-dependent dehydrogenase (short-subunit alcohol dehydrogenase family)